MAGIFDLIIADPGNESQLTINRSLVRTELTLAVLGVRTLAEVRTNLEGQIGRVFTSQEVADLLEIFAQIDLSAPTNVERIQRLEFLHKLEAIFNGGEVALITDADARSALNLSDPA
jgi:hypothetical protein